MRYLLFIFLTVAPLKMYAQDFHHELTDAEDSTRLHGLKLYLDIDSVYQVSDSSGVKFTLIIINQGNKTLEVTNPLYDTQLRINPSFWQLTSKQQIKLKEVPRWPYPHYAENIKPYRLEEVVVSEEEIPKAQYPYYWETDTLLIKPEQQIRYELNLFEQVLADVNNDPYFKPLFQGVYYVIFNIRIKVNDKTIPTNPLRFKLRLK